MPTIPIHKHYLSLGASNALGDSDPAGWVVGGYGPILLEKLKACGAEEPYTNLAQNGERTSTFIDSKYYWHVINGITYYNQLDAAVAYLNANAGQVSPVTLDIGSNDLLWYLRLKEKDHNDDETDGLANWQCKIHSQNQQLPKALDNAKKNLKETILPKLLEALTVNNQVTGSIVLMNFWNPLEPIPDSPGSECGEAAEWVANLNDALKEVARVFGDPVNEGPVKVADVYTRFHDHICEYTCMCPPQPGLLDPAWWPNMHANHAGYEVIAQAFCEAMGIPW